MEPLNKSDSNFEQGPFAFGVKQGRGLMKMGILMPCLKLGFISIQPAKWKSFSGVDVGGTEAYSRQCEWPRAKVTLL